MMSISAGEALPVVLVVEDEPLLRMLAVEVVEDAGFIAIEARDADEAVILLESRNDIVLLFTDINMPGSMDGLKLAHAVRNRWPPIKILVVSGEQQLQSSDLPSNSSLSGSPISHPRWSRNSVRSSVPVELGNPTPVNEPFCSDSFAERAQR